MDFQGWIERVRQFSNGLREHSGDIAVRVEIDPPLTNDACDQLAQRWPNGIPGVLRQLWTEGSARINCPFWWTPEDNDLESAKKIFKHCTTLTGGVCFEPAAKIYPGNSGADPNDTLIVETIGAAGLELACRCAIFHWFGNGDALGLDPRTNPDDPPVVFLTHDDNEHPTLAASFTEFLVDWETLCYITPEWWTLADAKQKPAELRSLFRLPL